MSNEAAPEQTSSTAACTENKEVYSENRRTSELGLLKKRGLSRSSITSLNKTGHEPTLAEDSLLTSDEEGTNARSSVSSATRFGNFISHFTGGARSSDTSTQSGGGRTRSMSSLPSISRTFTDEDRQWEQRKTAGGITYFYNTATLQVQLDPKPDFLKTPEEWEQEENGGESTWIPHPTLVWQAAKILKNNTATGEVTVKPLWQNGKPITIPANRIWKESGKPDMTLQMWALKELVLENSTDVDDLVALEDPNEAMLLHVLRERFVIWKKIYTWVGASKSVLISINPFQPRPELYSEQSMEDQRNDTEASLSIPPPPHLFGLCKGALELCLYDQQNCSVLISGESGAGKTEATKYCLKFLSADSGQDNSSVLESKLVNANLLLEEFGNARTNRNANSSRFGKWIQVFYDMKTRKICNSQLTTFLLERSRVIFQSKGEANYHIFNLVLQNEHLKQEHGLTGGDWRYISNSSVTSSKESDFKTILLSLTEIGFDTQEQECVFQLIAAILHLGQVDFEIQPATETLKISANKRSKTEHRGGASLLHRSTTGAEGGTFHFKEVCRLLGVQEQEFELAACFRSVSVRGEKSTIPISLVDARNSMDSLAMQLYGRMFDFLLAKINSSLASGGGGGGAKPKKTAWIGLLDIFGFEIFEKNSFEQLCINYCNEKLQQEFNSSTFKEEEGLYRFEEIDFASLQFQDNLPMLQFVEAKANGLFALLDDEVRVGGGNDTKFVSKLMQQHEKNPVLVSKRKRMESALHFTLVHYAGQVKYDAQGFVQANVETFRVELHLLMRTSQRDFYKSLFPAIDDQDGGKVRAKKQTISLLFRTQLNDLMQEIQNTESRYIRCIKPNALGQANQLDSVLVMEQLRYSGIFETVDIRRLGFPFRKTHLQFTYQFQCIHPPSTYTRTRDDDYQGRAEEIIQNIKGLAVGPDLQIGKTRVLYRTKQHHLLVLLRNLALEQRIVPWLQARVRGFIARQTKRLCEECEEMLKEALEDEDDVDRMEDVICETEEVLGERVFRLFPSIRLPSQQALEQKMKLVQQWNAIELEMEELLENDPREVEEMFFDLRALLKRVDELPRDNYELTRRQDRLLDQLRDRVANCTMQQQEKRFAEICEQATEALQALDRTRMKMLQTNFAQDTDIFQPGVQVFVDMAKKLEEMVDAERNLELAIKVMHCEQIVHCMKQCDQLKLDCSEAKRVLALPAHEFAAKELEVAKQHKDDRRRIHREIFLWEYEQEKSNAAKPIAYESLPVWRTLEEWQSHAKLLSRLFRREKLARTFKNYHKTPVHFALTSFGVPVREAASSASAHKKKRSNDEPNNEMDTVERRKQAVHISKLLTPMFLLGNNNASSEQDQDAALREILVSAMQDAPMRIELLVQILRMMHGNPDSASVQFGETLLGMCLLTFPLDPTLMEPWMLQWLKHRMPPQQLKKYWAAMETVRYDSPSTKAGFNKSIAQLRKEWLELEISPFALQPGQSSGPSDASQVANC